MWAFLRKVFQSKQVVISQKVIDTLNLNSCPMCRGPLDKTNDGLVLGCPNCLWTPDYFNEEKN